MEKGPLEATSNQEKKAYLLSEWEAYTYSYSSFFGWTVAAIRRLAGTIQPVTRRELGDLIGYTYERHEPNRRWWSGRFCNDI